MVKPIPGQTVGGAEWFEVIFLDTAALSAHGVIFTAILTHAMWVAPKSAFTGKGFLVRYRVACDKPRQGLVVVFFVSAYRLSVFKEQTKKGSTTYTFLATSTSFCKACLPKLCLASTKLLNLLKMDRIEPLLLVCQHVFHIFPGRRKYQRIPECA